MAPIIEWFESIFLSLPLPLLEVWGSFGYIVGLVLMFLSFGGLTLRPKGKWGLGREKQTWDLQALLSIPLTFSLIFITGYIGSFIVLVPGAQTFESLKDLSVFLCIVLFGYPALLAVPFAYGLSDLMEGVPPNFLLDWIVGYFINPACFWVAYQLIGRDPDFRKLRTWGWYFIFVLIFMSIEPELWGYICSDKFTPMISYRNITPALFFTTSITWIIAPFAMLAGLPLARKYNFFWAEIPGHVREMFISFKENTDRKERINLHSNDQSIPIRIFLVTPMIAIVLVMVGTTAYMTLSSAEVNANKLASRLHQEISENINLQLDDYLEKSETLNEQERLIYINRLLKKASIAKHGKAFVINRNAKIIASSLEGNNNEDDPSVATNNDLVFKNAINHLNKFYESPEKLKSIAQFQFAVITAKPLSRETWFTQATPYEDNSKKIDWIVVTSMPASYYLAGVREGNSKSAMVSAISLMVSLLIAAVLAGIVATPIRRISHATQAIALGDLSQRVPYSKLEELGALAASFNNMAKQLEESFYRTKASEERFRQLAETIQEVFWITTPLNEKLIYISPAYEKIWGRSTVNLYLDPTSWSNAIHEEDRDSVLHEFREQINGGIYDKEYRIKRPDGTIRWIHDTGFPIKDKNNVIERIVGVARDVTAKKEAEETIKELNSDLEKKVEERTEELRKSNLDLLDAVENLRKIMTELKGAQDQLLQTEKLAALGQLAASMTHELNTPLGAIVSSNRAVLNLIEDEIDQIPDLLASLEKEDIKKFKFILKESLKDSAKSENIPNRSIKKELVQTLKKAGFEDYDDLATLIMDNGIYQLGDNLIDILNTNKRTEILSIVSFFSTIVKLSSIISIATGKASHVVNALKNYLNPDGTSNEKDEISPVDIISEIETILTLYHGKIKYGVEIIKNYQTNEKCLGNGNKLNQVWINLLNNGLQSMNFKGKIEIEIIKQDSWIVTSFIDSGAGISEEIRNRIFEPFFTTKKHGEGIGLGLDISKKIIEKMQGRIEFESIPGRTKFSVWLKSAEAVS